MSRLEDPSVYGRDLMHPSVRAARFGNALQPTVSRTLLQPNAILFYGITVASLLETLTAHAAVQMSSRGNGLDDLDRWMRNDWSPRRMARSHDLRTYIAQLWPEFDWQSAQDRFLFLLSRSAAKPSPSVAAEAALVRCTAAAQGALFYRCLGSWAEDIELRRMALTMAREDQLAFGRFAAAYTKAAQTKRLGAYGAWRTATACMREARDHYVRAAFQASSDTWGPNSPFGTVSYADFLQRNRILIGTYGGLGLLERIVFRVWHERPMTDAPTSDRKQRWFRPILAAQTDMGRKGYGRTLTTQ